MMSGKVRKPAAWESAETPVEGAPFSDELARHIAECPLNQQNVELRRDLLMLLFLLCLSLGAFGFVVWKLRSAAPPAAVHGPSLTKLAN